MPTGESPEYGSPVFPCGSSPALTSTSPPTSRSFDAMRWSAYEDAEGGPRTMLQLARRRGSKMRKQIQDDNVQCGLHNA